MSLDIFALLTYLLFVSLYIYVMSSPTIIHNPPIQLYFNRVRSHNGTRVVIKWGLGNDPLANYLRRLLLVAHQGNLLEV